MPLIIRTAVPSDARALAELAAQTFHETFAADNRPEDMELYLAEAYGADQQHGEIVDPDITTLLAEVDGKLAGYAQVRSGEAPDAVTGPLPLELWRFYVAGPWQGRGVARVLMERVEVEARRRGAHTLWLGVWERNARAIAFYGKMGFSDVGSQPFQLGRDMQTDRIMMRLLA